MERIYIRIWYLKSLHYFFFSLAIFSITAGIMFFDFAALESLNFFVLGYFYCFSSLFIAYYFYKDYKETVEPFKVIRVYFVPYIVLVFCTMGSMLFLIWIFPELLVLMQSFLFVDYYIFFFIVVGFVLSRFKIVSRFFELYNVLVLNGAMKIAKEYARFVDVDEYKIGNDPEMDEILDEIWTHRDYPLPYIRKFEIAMCEKDIMDTNRMISRMRERGADETEKRIIRYLEKIKDGYLEKIRKIEQKVD